MMKLFDIPLSKDFADAFDKRHVLHDENVFLSGGGLDSAAFLAHLGWLMNEVVVYDYGQRTMEEEIIASTNMCKMLRQLHCHSEKVEPATASYIAEHNPNSMLLKLGTETEAELKGRNLMLIQEAINGRLRSIIDYNLFPHTSPIGNEYGLHKKALNIYVGLCKEEMMYPDANAEYIEMVNELMHRTYGKVAGEDRWLVNVYAPFSDVPKLEYIGNIRNMVPAYELYTSFAYSCWLGDGGVDTERLYQTYSDRSECGHCYHCKKRNKLFKTLDWYKPTVDLREPDCEVEEVN